MLLKYNSVDADMEKLTDEIYLPALKGTIPELVAESAKLRGLEAKLVRGSMEELLIWLKSGIPPIVFVEGSLEQSRGHFVVVTGYAPWSRRVRLHSGIAENYWVSAPLFEKIWKKGNYTAVLITPKK